jgi:hypothetical protein
MLNKQCSWKASLKSPRTEYCYELLSLTRLDSVWSLFSRWPLVFAGAVSRTPSAAERNVLSAHLCCCRKGRSSLEFDAISDIGHFTWLVQNLMTVALLSAKVHAHSLLNRLTFTEVQFLFPCLNLGMLLDMNLSIYIENSSIDISNLSIDLILNRFIA